MSALDPLSWAVLLMLIGCGLVVMEVFIPSGGILGFLSGVCIIGSIVMAFRRDSTTGIGNLRTPPPYAGSRIPRADCRP